ncbi:MAG: MFS transporter [Alphaproteobacteria bacterium]
MDRLLSAGYRRWLLTVLVIISAYGFVDRSVMTALAESIKQDLKLNDQQVGMLQGLGFAITYLLFGIPFARFSERFSRIWVTAIAITIWSVLTIACGAVTNYWQLLIGRAGVGLGEAGYGPPATSLISDHFPAEKRASAIAILWLGVPIGSLIGGAGGGFIAQAVDWRTAFIIVGVPGLLVALLTLFTLKEPPRGLVDGHPPSTDDPPSLIQVLKHLFKKPTFVHILLGSSLAAFGMNAIGQFMPIFFIRAYGTSIAKAGLAYGAGSAVALSFGLLMGAFIAEKAGMRDRRWWVWGPMVGILVAIPLYLWGFSNSSFWLCVLGIMLGNAFLFLYWSPTLAMVQNMSTPRMRASASAVLGLMLGVVGTAAGPTAMGYISDFIATRLFKLGDFHAMCPGGVAPKGAGDALVAACHAVNADGLRYALASTAITFVWGAVHFLLASRHVARDVFEAPDPAPGTRRTLRVAS